MIAFFLLLAAPTVEVAVIDAHTGLPISTGWTAPAPAGSLIKPFTALAYAATHDYRYPEFVCNGCWLPAGHGRIGIRQAVAYSCNSYFTQLASQVRPADVSDVLRRFGLPPLADSVTPRALIGLGDEWRVVPLDLMRAYRELSARQGEPGVADLLAGMAMSARMGTGKAAGPGVIVKTGTAPCVHVPHAPGDGYAMAISAERIILVRVHGVSGARAAEFVKIGTRKNTE